MPNNESTLEGFIEKQIAFYKQMVNGGTEPVARTDIKGFVVSTVFTSDEGFETAIGDANGFHPVERYFTKPEAVLGHEKWLAKIEGGLRNIDKLYYTGMPTEEVVLEGKN